MKKDNIFITGGEVSGESMIGYKEYVNSLTRKIEQKLNATGGIYVYGLYRMGKTSLLKKIIHSMVDNNSKLIGICIDLNKFNTAQQNSYSEFLDGIIWEIEAVLDNIDDVDDVDLTKVKNKISIFRNDDKNSMKYRMSFNNIFKYLKNAGIKVLLVVDEFDAAKDVFRSKADFELFRELAASSDFSVCLVTVSRQELSQIENENPNNSSFKGVMYPFTITGFNDGEITEFRNILKADYDYDLSDDEVNKIKSYCGSSPYLWSCIGYEIAEYQLLSNECNLDDILCSTTILSKIGGFHDSIYKCLEHDKDRNGVSFADKLVSAIIGPSFLASEEDIKLLRSMNYLVDTGSEYLAFSMAFKKYLMDIKYNNDILNNFDTLEKKSKVLLESKKEKLFKAINNLHSDDNENWFDVLKLAWQNKKGQIFKDNKYRSYINDTNSKFGKTVTVLDVMSLENVMIIIRSNWDVFSPSFNSDALADWEIKLIECGKARNPVHHGSVERVYTIEEQNRINSYCSEIIKQLS